MANCTRGGVLRCDRLLSKNALVLFWTPPSCRHATLRPAQLTAEEMPAQPSAPILGKAPLSISSGDAKGSFVVPCLDTELARDAGKWTPGTEIYEYTSAANPEMPPVTPMVLQAAEHGSGPTRITSLDLSKSLGIDGYPATCPNLLASFLRINVGETLTTTACATSQAFYVIHGRGRSESSEFGELQWDTGDLFVIPSGQDQSVLTHICLDDSKEGTGGAGLYWLHDAPLLAYLGVIPREEKFKPTYFSQELLASHVESVRHEPGAEHRNRLGILLGNTATAQTKTLTHVLWSLLNVLPPGDVQRPHRHNSTALDLCLHAAPGTYTLMGKELDRKGEIVDPIRADWESGSMFVTPPGWWHSHHNDSSEEAWVLPVQDAGLFTYQRTLDIRFAEQETDLLSQSKIR